MKGMENGRIRRSDGVEQIAGDDDHGRLRGNDVIDSAPKRGGDVCFALVDTLRRQAMVLPETQVDIRKVGELHGLGTDLLTDRGLQRHHVCRPLAGLLSTCLSDMNPDPRGS